MTLYKYLPTNRIDVIEKQFIRCTPATSQNDIFEMRVFFEKVIDESDAEKLFADIDIDKIVFESYKTIMGIASGSKGSDTYNSLFKKFIDSPKGKNFVKNIKASTINQINSETKGFEEQINKSIPENVGIISLTESYDNKLMWAHYGEKHKGFLIAFNENHKFFNRKRKTSDEFYYLRKVNYCDSKSNATIYKTSGTDLFLRKDIEWAYEKEWRLLIPLQFADKIINPNSEQIHLIKFPLECINGIICGANASPSFMKLIYDYSYLPEFRKIKFGNIKLNNQSKKLELHWMKNY